MGLENSKRWHWVAVSLVVGPLLAFMNSQAEPGAGLRSMAGNEFEREIVQKEVPGEQPNIRKIVVHPAQPGAYDRPVNVVTMERAVYDRAEKGWRYQPYAMLAEVPYGSGPGGSAAGDAAGGDRTILTALEEIKRKNPTVQYSYAWWEEPVWRYGLWSAGSVVVVGGIWPTVILLLIGAGLAPQPKEKEYDLERFGKGEAAGQTEGAPTTERREMTDDDRSKLQEQLAKLQENVGSSTVMTDVPGVAGRPATAGGPAPIQKLTGGLLELQAADKEEEEKEYKGEFYPVAKVVHPKNEQPTGHTP